MVYWLVLQIPTNGKSNNKITIGTKKYLRVNRLKYVDTYKHDIILLSFHT